MEITLDAIKNNIDPLTARIDSILEANDCSTKSKIQIDVAVDEIFSNIANYAYLEDGGTATIIADVYENDGEKYFKLIFKDGGIPFNPLDRPDPDITLGVDERQIGGLGIFMVKKTMDSVTYEYVDGCNILTLVKKI